MAAQRREQSGGGGLPDGLVVGIIALLLGVTVLVWTATGVAGLLSHGAWPSDVHFTRTPRAMRGLIGQPHDLPGAWPGAKPSELPGPGLFWGIFIGQFMVLFAVAVWVLNVLARLRARARRGPVRAAPAPVAQAGSGPDPSEQEPSGPGASGPLPAPRRRGGDAGYGPGTAAGAGAGAGAYGGRGKGGEGDGLDAWFRTVPQAVPPRPADPVTAELPPVGEDPPPAPREARPPALDGGEVTRTYALFAGPRGDQAKRVVQPAVLAAAGPVLVTTADPDTYHQTVGNRSKLGPVHVYDPAHLLDVPGRLRWAPHGGCERPATAGTRAAALLAPLRTARADEAIVHSTAVTLLRCWLHAAAVDGRPFRQVHRWAAGGAAAADAVRILRSDTGAASGWSGELESVLHAHPDRRDAAQALIRQILAPLNSVHIRDACNPSRTGGLDVESWAAELGTLYVVGERIEDPRSHLGAMPLLTALVSSVVEHGRRMAAGSPAGRLDPPLTFVLDDVAALAPVPDLPALLAEGTTAGLPTLAVLRSPEQATARWQAPLWQDADLRLALDGEAAASVRDAIRLR
ncbi:type IV secretory system conjugative DNA transfer family protein [Actinacidiphila epipremni]|uniref:type IV secretory system conjugative DNA transfer family protein n=1 Tax=Actinacidiphila epipremni TaxID=2053013 RepID=UPI002B00329A|nr:type IV secretory system conjugative DNA transfer family protein [Actinacidiphila epipremni]